MYWDEARDDSMIWSAAMQEEEARHLLLAGNAVLNYFDFWRLVWPYSAEGDNNAALSALDIEQIRLGQGNIVENFSNFY